MNKRVDIIWAALTAALAPEHLEIRDQSHLHAGHAGARDGRGHFAVDIVCAAFEGEALRARHQMIYDSLGPLMQTDIHALKIRAKAPSELSD